MIGNLVVPLIVLSVCAGLEYDDDYNYFNNANVESKSVEVDGTAMRRPDVFVKVKTKTKTKVSTTKAMRRSTEAYKPATEGEASIECNWPPKYISRVKNTEVIKDNRRAIKTSPEVEAHHRHNAVVKDHKLNEPSWPPKVKTPVQNTEVIKNDRKVIETSPKVEKHRNVDKSELKTHDRQAAELTVDHGGIANYPFSVSLLKMGSHYASGALIDKQWIMSAAEQFHNARESIRIFRARLGSVDCKRGGELLPLKRISIHPSFVPGKPDSDVSLLQLAKLVEFSDWIMPIAFTRILVKEKLLSAKFLATYWPRVIVNGTVLPKEAEERKMHTRMRVSTQRMIKWDKCANIMAQMGEVLPKSSLCLKPVHSHHTICLPDVGAPILANDGLWAITSGWVSRNCSKHPSPTVATRVSSPTVRLWYDSVVFEDNDSRSL